MISICDEPETNEVPVEIILPLIKTLPVNRCKSSIVSPNVVDPDSYKTEEVTIDVCISFAVMIPDTFNEPVIDVVEFTLNPFELTEAVTAPLAILSNCNPVTPVAGILYKLVPSPLKEPVNEPVLYDEVKEFKLLVLDCKLSNFELTEPELMDDDTKESVTSTPFNIKDPVIFALTIRIVFM